MVMINMTISQIIDGNFNAIIHLYMEFIDNWTEFIIWSLGYTLPDAPLCQHCGPETFACGNGNNGNHNHNEPNLAINCTCIPIRWRCDGDVDCLNDSSDEIGCGKSSLISSYLQVFLWLSFGNSRQIWLQINISLTDNYIK